MFYYLDEERRGAMVENIAFGIKGTVFVVAIWNISRFRMNYIPLLFVLFFLTGVELILPSDTPWSLLLSADSTDRYIMSTLCVVNKTHHQIKGTVGPCTDNQE